MQKCCEIKNSGIDKMEKNSKSESSPVSRKWREKKAIGKQSRVEKMEKKQSESTGKLTRTCFGSLGGPWKWGSVDMIPDLSAATFSYYCEKKLAAKQIKQPCFPSNAGGSRFWSSHHIFSSPHARMLDSTKSRSLPAQLFVLQCTKAKGIGTVRGRKNKPNGCQLYRLDERAWRYCMRARPKTTSLMYLIETFSALLALVRLRFAMKLSHA